MYCFHDSSTDSVTAADKAQILLRNAHQILDIVTAAFGSQVLDLKHQKASCSDADSDIDELACGWRSVARKADIIRQTGVDDPEWILEASKVSCPASLLIFIYTDYAQWLRKAQRLMSSMASNYDMNRLMLGQGAAIAAVIACVVATTLLLDATVKSALPFAFIVSAYGVMMFASSYVEEEHHFWYWSTTAWLVYIGQRGFSRQVTGHISSTLLLTPNPEIYGRLQTKLLSSWLYSQPRG
jgi:ethanolaminephosphotransferase